MQSLQTQFVKAVAADGVHTIATYVKIISKLPKMGKCFTTIVGQSD